MLKLGVGHQAAQVGYGWNDTVLHEVGFLLKVASETVGAQHLQGAE